MHIYEYAQRRKEIKHKRTNASEKRKPWQDRRKEKKTPETKKKDTA